MVGRNSARYLAPLALAATITGTLLIVGSTLNAKSAAAHHVAGNGHGPRGEYAKQSYYTVQSGDSLSAIAAKTGVALDSLERLNPTVDPATLQPGRRLRLRR